MRTRSRLNCLVMFAAMTCSLHAADQPNFVFFLVDDLGFMDISPNNPDTFYETPNLNRLAAEGVRFTHGYAANPVCSPTRYSILTGKYPTRVAATNFFSGTREGRFKPAPLHSDMPLEEITIAERLHAHGYKTMFLGKWHLGPTQEFWPEHQGFDVNVGGNVRGAPNSYFSPYRNPRLADGPEGEHLTRRLTDEALKLLDESKDKPFLLYLAFYTVHTPLQAPKDLVEKYQAKAKSVSGSEFGPEEQVWPEAKQERQVRIAQKHPVYAAMVETMDTSVGRILDKLQALGIDNNTVVCFFSDNGGLSTSEGSPTSNLPLRGGKGWVYEGGIREPMIIKWPHSGHAGEVCHEPVISVDFYPTILEIAGIDAPQDLFVDGRSLVPLLQGEAIEPRNLYWHYPHYSNQGGFPGGAIRKGQYKLIERYEDGRVHLFDTDADVSEQNDLAQQMPDRVQSMRAALHNWYQVVDAKFLEPKQPGDPQPWRPEF